MRSDSSWGGRLGALLGGIPTRKAMAPPHQCPRCKSNHHIDMVPIKLRYPGSDGRLLEEVVGSGVTCFECGFVYGITDAGVIQRKERQAEPAPPSAPGPAPHERGSDSLNRVTEGLRWRKSKV